MADDDLFAEAFATVEREGTTRSDAAPVQLRPPTTSVRAPVHPAFRPRQANGSKVSQPENNPVNIRPPLPVSTGWRAGGISTTAFYANTANVGNGGGRPVHDDVQITKQTVNPVFARAAAGNKWNAGGMQQRRKPTRKISNERSAVLIEPPTTKFGRGNPPVITRQPRGDEDGSKFRYGTVTHQNVPEHYAGFDVEAGNTWIYPINFARREYQFTICEHALFYNTLVSLPTGLGKTFIAAVIMYNFYRWYPTKKVLFAAPTRPLVAQQMRACYEVMGVPQYHMAELTGAMSPSDRMAVWRDKRMLFLTPQVIKNDLTLMAIQPEDIICIVFDEAHAAHGNHAYCNIIREMIVKTTQFRVLALSATPGKNRDSIQEVIKNLLISRVDIRTNESMDITPYTHTRRITVDIIQYDQQTQDFIDRFQAVINNYVKRLKSFGGIPDHMPNHKLTPYMVMMFQKQFRNAPTRVMNKTMLQIAYADFALVQSLTRAGESLRFYGLRSFWRHMVQFLDGQRGNPRVKSEFVMNPAIVKLQADVCRALRIEDENVTKLTQQHNSPAHKQTHAAYQRSLLNMSLGRHGGAATQANYLGPSQEAACSPKDDFVYGHPKMKRLEEIILEHFSSHENELRYNETHGGSNKPQTSPANVTNTTRCIVFVQYRDSCAEITTMLERHEPLLRASMFVGQSSRGATKNKQQSNFLDGEDDLFMDEAEKRAQFLRNKQSGRVGQKQREQLEVIQKFRSGVLNTIVATCVGEEGLDVGEVDLIICYDMQKSPVRMVQRMGRTGRKREGRVVVLLTEGLEEEKYSKANQTKDDAADQLARTADYVYYHECPRLVPRGIKPRIEQVMLKQRAFKEEKKVAKKSKLHDESFDSEKKAHKIPRLDDWLRSGVLLSGMKNEKPKKRSKKVDNFSTAATVQVEDEVEDHPLRLDDDQYCEYQLKYKCDLENDNKLPPNRLQFGIKNVSWPNYDENAVLDEKCVEKISYDRVEMMKVGTNTQDTRKLRLTAFGSAYQSVPTPTFAFQHADRGCGTLIKINKLLEHFRTFEGDENEIELFERGGFAAIEAAHADVNFDFQYAKENPCDALIHANNEDDMNVLDDQTKTDENCNGDVCDEDFAAIEADFDPPFVDYASFNKSQNLPFTDAVLPRTDNEERREQFNEKVVDDFDVDMLAELDLDVLEQKYEQTERLDTQNTSLNSAMEFLQPTQQNDFAVPRVQQIGAAQQHEDVIEQTPLPAPGSARSNASNSFLRCTDEIVGISNIAEDENVPLSDSFFDAAFYADSNAPVLNAGAVAPVASSTRKVGSLVKGSNLIGAPRHSSTPRQPILSAMDGKSSSGFSAAAENVLSDVLSPIRSLSMITVDDVADNTVKLPPDNNITMNDSADDWQNEVVTQMQQPAVGDVSSIHCKQKLDFDANRSESQLNISFSIFHEINNINLHSNPSPTPPTAQQPHQPQEPDKIVSTSSIPNGLSRNNHSFRSPFLSPLRVDSDSEPRSTSRLSTATIAASNSSGRGKRLGMTGGFARSVQLHTTTQNRVDADDGFSMPAICRSHHLPNGHNNSEPSPKHNSDEKIFKSWRVRVPANASSAVNTDNAAVLSDDSPIGPNRKAGDEQRPIKIQPRRLKSTKSAFLSDEDDLPPSASAPAANAGAVLDDSIVELAAPADGASRRIVGRQASLPSPRQNVPRPRRRPRQRNEFLLTQAEVSDEEGAASADEDDIRYNDAEREREEYEAEMSSFINHNEPTQTGIDVRQLYAQELRARDQGLSVDGFMAQLRARVAPRISPGRQQLIQRLGYDPRIYSQAPDEDDELNDTYDEGDGFVVKD